MEQRHNNWTPKSIKTWNRELWNVNSMKWSNQAINKEFEQMEPKLDENVSFKPPLAYKPTQFRLAMEIELPELLLPSILPPSIDYR